MYSESRMPRGQHGKFSPFNSPSDIMLIECFRIAAKRTSPFVTAQAGSGFDRRSGWRQHAV
jgi:hypothetical protein